MRKIHFCNNCGRPQTKVTGTKGTYECKRCGVRLNPNYNIFGVKKQTLKSVMKEAKK